MAAARSPPAFLRNAAHLDGLRGRRAEQQATLEKALALDPADEDTLVAQGADDPGALRLLVDVKGRTSLLLGVWWRWQTLMGAFEDGPQLVVLLGGFYLVAASPGLGWCRGDGEHGGAAFQGARPDPSLPVTAALPPAPDDPRLAAPAAAPSSRASRCTQTRTRTSTIARG